MTNTEIDTLHDAMFPAPAFNFGREPVRAFALAVAAHERSRCAEIARNGCLVLPDGGSPTEDKRLLCEEIERRILAAPQQPDLMP